MGGYGDIQLLRDDGLRLDGRKLDESRPVSIQAGILPAADGSAMVTHGLNVAVAAVYGPMEAHPRKIQRQDRAVIDVRYNMAPFSTSDRIRPGYNRRSREISKVTAEALESAVLVERFPRSKIRVEIEILAAEAGTRCAGITAASVALAGLGFDNTIVKLIADSTIEKNIHELEIEGKFGVSNFIIKGLALPSNPKSSSLAAMSMVSEVKKVLGKS